MSGDGERWVLLNASPDIHAQLGSFPSLRPSGRREVPLSAVLLTDAELDHTLGLLLLREGGGLTVHATEAVHDTLCDGTSVLRTLEAYCPVTWQPVVPDVDVALGGGLTYRAFEVPTTKRARFGATGRRGRVVGYRLTDAGTGRALVWLPAVQALTPEVRERIDGCACLLVDGTCWSDDELVRLGLAGKTARAMGHLPISGPDGSLEQLSSLRIGRTVYVHPTTPIRSCSRTRPSGGSSRSTAPRSPSTGWSCRSDDHHRDTDGHDGHRRLRGGAARAVAAVPQ